MDCQVFASHIFPINTYGNDCEMSGSTLFVLSCTITLLITHTLCILNVIALRFPLPLFLAISDAACSKRLTNWRLYLSVVFCVSLVAFFSFYIYKVKFFYAQYSFKCPYTLYRPLATISPSIKSSSFSYCRLIFSPCFCSLLTRWWHFAIVRHSGKSPIIVY